MAAVFLCYTKGREGRGVQGIAGKQLAVSGWRPIGDKNVVVVISCEG